MRNKFGNKFNSTWINANPTARSDYDGDEYWELTGHASNLGLSEIWYYMGSGWSYLLLENFCYNAWKNGWLKRFEREYYEVWKCKYWENPTGCDPDDPDDWYYDGKFYTGNVKEASP